MAIALSPINSMVENLANKELDLGGAGITVALTNTAHTSTWDELSDLTQISYTNLSARVVTVTSCAQTAGTLKLVLADLTLTATDTVGPFRYIYLYDDTSTNDKLLWYYDYGSALTLETDDSIKLNFDGTSGALTISSPA